MRDLSEGRILVTGGAGLIGSAMVWELNSHGLSNILVVDRLRSSEKWKNLTPLRFEDYWEAEDLAQRVEQTPDTLAGITTIFHLGACSSTTETDATYLVRNNFEYTKRLAEWALSRGVRFVYASSAATYGALEHDLSENRDLHSLRPLNMYGYSKHLFDCYASAQGFLSQVVGLKYFNIFGPNEDHKGNMRSVVQKAFHQVVETGKVQLFKSYRPEIADGCQQRDFLYIKDAVKMTVHLAAYEPAGGLYNIGSGCPNTWLDLATALFAAMGREPNIEFIEMPQALRAKYQYFTCAIMDRFRQTGYAAPLQTLPQAVSDYVHQYLNPGRRLGDEVPAA